VFLNKYQVAEVSMSQPYFNRTTRYLTTHHPWLDVRAFAAPGMKCDGSDDWQPVLQAAIDHVISISIPGGHANDSIANDIVGTLYLPGGIYRIDRPLHIISRPARNYDDRGRLEPRPSDPYSLCSIQIIGDAPGFEGLFHGTIIRATFTDMPAIVIEGGRAIRLKHLDIEGLNNWYYHYTQRGPGGALAPEVFLYEDYYPEQEIYRELYSTGWSEAINPDGSTMLEPVFCRDDRYSPYAGICIDPYSNRTPPDEHRYPRLADKYPQGLPGDDRELGFASSAIAIEDCTIRGFVVGVAISPSGSPTMQNAEDITLSNCSIGSTKSSISIGQDQSRNVTLRNVSLGGAKYAIDCMNYGKGSGNCPAIFGANVGRCKYIFNATSVGATPSINGLYAEAFMSLGRLRGGFSGGMLDGYVFNSCSFSFYATTSGSGSIDLHLLNEAATIFNGCSFGNTESSNEPIKIYNRGTLSLNSCFFTALRPDDAARFWISGFKERVHVQNTAVSDGLHPERARFSDHLVVDVFDNYATYPVFPGSFFASTIDFPNKDQLHVNAPALDEYTLRWVPPKFPTIIIGGSSPSPSNLHQERVEVSFDRATGTATFQTRDYQLLREGDLILMYDDEEITDLADDVRYPGTRQHVYPRSAQLLLGKISEPVSDPTVKVSFVPASLLGRQSAQARLRLVYFPRIHPATVGDTTQGRSHVEVAIASSNVTGMTPATAWAVGNRIRGRGIAPGTHITQIEQVRDATRGTVYTFTISRPATESAKHVRLYDADIRTIEMHADPIHSRFGSHRFNGTAGAAVTHNLGHLRYRVAVTPTGSLNGRWHIAKEPNSFTVYSTDANDTTQGFDYVVLLDS
jgi:hypothetical protein